MCRPDAVRMYVENLRDSPKKDAVARLLFSGSGGYQQSAPNEERVQRLRGTVLDGVRPTRSGLNPSDLIVLRRCAYTSTTGAHPRQRPRPPKLHLCGIKQEICCMSQTKYESGCSLALGPLASGLSVFQPECGPVTSVVQHPFVYHQSKSMTTLSDLIKREGPLVFRFLLRTPCSSPASRFSPAASF